MASLNSQDQAKTDFLTSLHRQLTQFLSASERVCMNAFAMLETVEVVCFVACGSLHVREQGLRLTLLTDCLIMCGVWTVGKTSYGT